LRFGAETGYLRSSKVTDAWGRRTLLIITLFSTDCWAGDTKLVIGTLNVPKWSVYIDVWPKTDVHDWYDFWIINGDETMKKL
jgi:hypothetical protein